jgi:N2227-like protein
VPATRSRIEETLRVAKASCQSIDDLMQSVGISARFDEQLAHLNLGPISEYYHHILQDWAWGDDTVQQRLEPILASVQPSEAPVLLALGAGAGRLSWELHKTWGAQYTLATDINPLLLAASHRLIVRKEAFDFCELNSFPQIGKNASAIYTLKADSSAEHPGWMALAADVWRMPLQPNSVDIILTAWFIDVHGGDNRELIGLIHHWLKPGGVWVNSGPLLYPKAMPIERKYNREELLELINLAGFELTHQALNEHQHLNSPINVRRQTEQVWTFCARKPAAAHTTTNTSTTNTSATNTTATNTTAPSDLPPAWLVFHHLPIPQIFTPPSESHPLIDQILAHVDGQHSINSLSAQIATQVPEGLDPLATVVEVLGALLDLP